MEKLMITATTANSWIYPDLKNWAQDDDHLVKDAVDCAKAGAAIVHVHLPRGRENSIVERIRAQTDALIQAGMSSESIPQRKGDFEAKPDMMSVILNHHAEHFTGIQVDRVHSLEELEQYCILFRESGIRPEWEVWNTGSLWNLAYLRKKGLISTPVIMTLFFGWPGGTWSPPTAEEFFHRVRHVPTDGAYAVSAMGEEQTLLAMLSIASGGHVRVGTEDWPFIRPGEKATNNATLVARMARIARELGREVATPTEARRILKLDT